MQNISLLTPVLSDQAILTATDAVGDMAAVNLQRLSLFRKYRTLSLTPSISLDFGTAQEIDTLALIAHNGSGSLVIKAGSTNAASDFTSSSYDLITGDDFGYGVNLCFVKLPAAQTYRYWKIEITDTSNPNGFFECGRLYLGKVFQPALNADYGFNLGFIDNSKVTRTRSGNAVPLTRRTLKKVGFSLSFGTEAEMYNNLFEIDMLRGQSKDILFILDTDSANIQKQNVYGLMKDMQPIIHSAFRIYQKQYTIEELPAWQ